MSKRKTPVSPLPTVATLPVPEAKPAKAKVIALRGGPAISTIQLTGNKYRTGVKHNADWWFILCDALAAGPTAVEPLVGSGVDGKTVPSHFITYTLRRGYISSVE